MSDFLPLKQTALDEPTIRDAIAAAARIRPHLAPTPLRQSTALSEILGADVYLKHEHHLPTGAFKVRGGVNLISQLTPAEQEAGVIAASTGNHGQSVAYAARLFGVRAIVCAPENANPGKPAIPSELKTGTRVRIRLELPNMQGSHPIVSVVIGLDQPSTVAKTTTKKK